MHDLSRKLITEWRRLELPFANETLILAVSGGADSAALAAAIADLHKRKKLRHRFVIAHFDHGLRGEESKKDAEFVRNLAQKLGFEFVLEAGNVGKKGNIEQNARLARYDFLHRVAIDHMAIAVLTAHTLNDQAETFLLNLIRGSGIDGLKAMPPVRQWIANSLVHNEVNVEKLVEPLLIRPFLRTVKREETEAFCENNGIDFRHDQMNDDLAYKRVRVRKELLPLLAEYNPKIVETLANTAELMNLTAASEDLRPGRSLSKDLKLSKLRTMPKPELNAVLRNWINEHRGGLRGISSKHLTGIINLIDSKKSGKTAELSGGESIQKQNGKLVYIKSLKDVKA